MRSRRVLWNSRAADQLNRLEVAVSSINGLTSAPRSVVAKLAITSAGTECLLAEVEN
jgi:hypothetical protein